MAERSIKVRVMAEIGQYVSNMRKASRAAEEVGEDTEKASDKATAAAKRQEKAWADVSTGLVVIGTVGATSLGLVTKAAMDWESAWTGVQKTVDGTPEQMQAVEDGLRGLTEVLPAAHGEIAAVAEAAGQLGIATPDIVGFTRTMIDLGESTNLGAEEAATSLARFMNIMGTSSDDVSRLGSVMVGLGNNFATTEAEIMGMSMRLAGTGNQIGLSEGEVMGLAAAMSSVGIEAEAGGTAMSMTMSKINTAVKSGDDTLAGFAQTAGMSAEEFATAWTTDPAAALDAFVQGVGRAGEAGQDVNTMLDDLGIKGVREIDTLLRLGGAGELMAEAFAQGNLEFQKNSALAEEAAKRYETTESKVRIAWNGIKDAAIDAGAIILPVVATLAEGAAGIAQAFTDLPEPVQGAITMLGGLVGVSALVVGSGMKMASMAGDAARAMGDLGINTDKAKGKLKGVGKLAAGAAVGLMALQAAGAIANMTLGEASAVGVPKMTNALSDLDGGVKRVNDTFKNADFTNGRGRWQLSGTVSGINDVGDAVSRLADRGLGDGIADFFVKLVGGKPALDMMEEQLANLDTSIATMAQNGNMAKATATFKEFAEQTVANGDTAEDAAKQFPQLEDAVYQYAESMGYTLEPGEALQVMLGNIPPGLRDAAAAATEAGEGAAEGAEGLDEMTAAAEETEQTLGDLFEIMKMMGMVSMDARTATSNFHAALGEVDDTLKEIIESEGKMGPILNEMKTDFDLTSEAGAKANEAFQDVAKAGWDMAEANAAAGGSFGEVAGNLQTTYDKAVAAAETLGITGEAAHDLAREVMSVPDGVEIDTWASDAALKVIEKTGNGAKDLPDKVKISTWMADDAFIEAIRTKAAALDIPEHEAISSFMESYARGEADDTTRAVLDIPEGVDIWTWMDENAKNEAWRTKEAVDAIPREVHIKTFHENIESWEKTSLGAGDMATAGKNSVLMPGLAGGGRLPSTGLGTDKIVGMSSLTGLPTAMVDDREWVINRRSSDKYDGLLHMINSDDPRLRHLSGLAGGGRASSREYASASFGMAPRGTSSALDIAGLEAAVERGTSRGVSQWRPAWQISGRQFDGVMQHYTRSKNRG